MQPPPPPGLRGYSDFFASGLRAPPASTSHARSRSSNDARPSSILSAGRTYITHTKSSSMSAAAPVRPSALVAGRPQPMNTNINPVKQAKRASLVSLARIFEHTSLFSSRRASRVVPDRWVAAGGTNTPSAPNGSPALRPLDPFAASPDTRSMFIDLDITPESSPGGTPIQSPTASGGVRESHLSLTGSYSTQALLFAPNPSPQHAYPSGTHGQQSTPTQDTFPSFLSLAPSSVTSLLFPFSSGGAKRARPTSVQTMPLPARSRRSSFSVYLPHQTPEELDRSREREREREREKFDAAWIVEEELPLRDDRATGEWDAPAKIDWHQFHIDILADETSSPPAQ